MPLERVLLTNIMSSSYFRGIENSLANWREVVDEIYYSVEHVEPWMAGNTHGPSTAFCILHKLGTMRMTDKQIAQTLDHPDSPYIRALGVLYCRYAIPPRELWDYLGKYVDDDEPIAPGADGREVTFGAYVRDVLLSMHYFETIFPRIPLTVEQAIVAKLREKRLPTEAVGNGGAGGRSRRGGDGAAGGGRRPQSVKQSLSVSMGRNAPPPQRGGGGGGYGGGYGGGGGGGGSYNDHRRSDDRDRYDDRRRSDDRWRRERSRSPPRHVRR